MIERPGVVRAVIDTYLRKAREANVPVVLGATNTSARDMYLHYGFKLVEKFIVGRGNTSPNGSPQERGARIPVFFMIYHPDEEA